MSSVNESYDQDRQRRASYGRPLLGAVAPLILEPKTSTPAASTKEVYGEQQERVHVHPSIMGDARTALIASAAAGAPQGRMYAESANFLGARLNSVCQKLTAIFSMDLFRKRT